MTRIVNITSSAKAVAASTTVIFTPSDLPGDRVVSYLVGLTGAGNTLGGTGLTQIRVKANGTTLWDITAAQLISFYRRFTKANVNVSAAAVFEIPFYLLDETDEDKADICQFPPNSQPQLEFVFGAGAGAGFINVLPVQSTITPRFVPRLYSQTMNISASVVNQNFPLSDGGFIRALMVPTTGLIRFRLVLNGIQFGNAYGAASTPAMDFWSLLQRQYTDIGNPDPVTLKFPLNVGATPGSSFGEFDTSGAWVGVANPIGIYSLMGL